MNHLSTHYTTDIWTTARSPIQEITGEELSKRGIKLFIKRDDLLQFSGMAAPISGNKFRKMKYNLLEMHALGLSQLVTFGGAFSNHIHAVAAAGLCFGIKTTGIIRGERAYPLSTTLAFAEQKGMNLIFVSRTEYRDKNLIINKLKDKTSEHFYYLPEGGTNNLAIRGCIEIVTETQQELSFMPDYYCVASGTGGTIAGLIEASDPNQTVIGFSALKGDFLKNDIKQWLTSDHQNWCIKDDYCAGGYAKWSPELINFINNFKQKYNIPLDPIYTGKMMYGLFDLIQKDYFKKNSTIVAVHTGGLQGIEGFNQRFGELIDHKINNNMNLYM